MSDKTLGITDVKGAKDNIEDLEVFGNGDLFRLVSKASSEKEGWMKSTKAREIKGMGCIVQVTTQQGERVAEALCYVPGAELATDDEGNRCFAKIEHGEPGYGAS